MTFWKASRSAKGECHVGCSASTRLRLMTMGPPGLDGEHIGVGDGDGTHPLDELVVVQVARGSVLQLGPGDGREAARGGAFGAQRHLRVHEHVVDEPLHAVGQSAPRSARGPSAPTSPPARRPGRTRTARGPERRGWPRRRRGRAGSG